MRGKPPKGFGASARERRRGSCGRSSERFSGTSVGIARNKKSLSQALKAMEQMEREKLPAARRSTPKEILEKLEMENALRVGEMISRSALLREESRGAHYREDFPETDEARWKGNIFLKNDNGKMDLEFSRFTLKHSKWLTRPRRNQKGKVGDIAEPSQNPPNPPLSKGGKR